MAQQIDSPGYDAELEKALVEAWAQTGIDSKTLESLLATEPEPNAKPIEDGTADGE